MPEGGPKMPTEGPHRSSSTAMGWFRTYRALITIVLVVCLVVFVPRLRSDNANTKVQGASPGTDAQSGSTDLGSSAGREPLGGPGGTATSIASPGGTASAVGPQGQSGPGATKAG